jgi:4-diphosphocytidyl-2-C-methyl-D-erythritol kinase
MCVSFVMKVQLFSPAKINVFLSVIGPRDDGFHDLLSVVTPLDFGDELELELLDSKDKDELICDHPEIPLGESNLIMKAVNAFRETSPFRQNVKIWLQKKIPMGGGLGGGSGNAAAVLQGLNTLLECPLSESKLSDLAASIGSDCPLFLSGGAVMLRGRGELVEKLPLAVCRVLADREVFLLMPGIGVSTAWAYQRFRELGGDAYDCAEIMEENVQAFLQGKLDLETLLHNNFEPLVYDKFLGLSVFRDRLQDLFPAGVLLSGSGSTLFIISPPNGFRADMDSGLESAGLEAFGVDFELVKARTAPFESAPFVPRP